MESNGTSQDQSQPETRRTRSGRTVRSVERYEPDENTVFEDDVPETESVLSELEHQLTDYEDSDCESYATEDEEDEDTDSDDDEVVDDEVETIVEEDEYLADAIDWDNLTDDAQSGDESNDDDMDSDCEN